MSCPPTSHVQPSVRPGGSVLASQLSPTDLSTSGAWGSQGPTLSTYGMQPALGWEALPRWTLEPPHPLRTNLWGGKTLPLPAHAPGFWPRPSSAPHKMLSTELSPLSLKGLLLPRDYLLPLEGWEDHVLPLRRGQDTGGPE